MSYERVNQSFAAIAIRHSCALKDYPVYIPRAFDELAERMNEIESHSNVKVALYEPGNPSPKPDDVEVWYVGVLTEGEPDIPEGMEYRVVPARQYVKCLHKGEISKIGNTYMNAAGWVKAQGLQLDTDWVVERYDERFSRLSPESKMEIYMPIKQA